MGSGSRRSPSPALPTPQLPTHSDTILGSRLISPEKVIEALHYLAPEQASSTPSAVQEDHRADLYSLGMLFWTPAEVLVALGTKRPPSVGEVRADVPSVIGDIIDKLLSKSPDARYQSAYGLKSDLLECQKRLLASVSASALEEPTEARRPARPFVGKKINTPSQGTGTNEDDDSTPSSPVSGEDSPKISLAKIENVSNLSAGRNGTTPSPVNSIAMSARGPKEGLFPHSAGTSDAALPPNALRKVALQSKERSIKAHAIVIAGAGGQVSYSWKPHGLWAQAKFQASDSAPFVALLSALSSALRQLMSTAPDAYRFVRMLTERLGPQLANLPLLFAGSPAVKAVLEAWGMNTAAFEDGPENAIEKVPGDTKELSRLATSELSARFQNLVESVLGVISEIRPLALFLDDIHEADNASLDVIEALINSRSRLLIFATLRSANGQLMDRVRSMCSHRARTTWITLEQLPFSAISTLVAKTLHRTREDCSRLSRLVYTASGGNAFLARNVLTGMQRHNHITFDWARNHWQFDITAIESNFVNQAATTDPTDQSFLIANFRELPQVTRKYLIWASFLGTTFKANEVALLIDWEDSSGSSSEEEADDPWNLSRAISMLKHRSPNSGDAIRGLQGAINEGWLVQRGREMCTFAHDRYRQAVQQEAGALPETVLSRMSFRVILAVLHDAVPDGHRIAEHAGRCIPLLLKQPNREQLLDVLVDAGESAWARGAHEAFLSARCLRNADHWSVNPGQSALLVSKLAELYTWKGDLDQSEQLIAEYIQQSRSPEDHARALRVRADNHFLRNEFVDALNALVLALHSLGVEVDVSPTQEVVDKMFEDVKNQILAIGYDEILRIPRATDPRIDLAVSLLNDAGTNAYWSLSETMIEAIGLTTLNLALREVCMLIELMKGIQPLYRSGISPGTSLGFFWVTGAAAEKRELFKFSVDLGKLALRFAYLHGGSREKCRATVLYAALVAPYDNVHIRHTIPLLEDGLKYGHSSGDRLALIACVRRQDLTSETRSRYLDQVVKNQTFLRRWLSSSPVNIGAWIALVEAEMASINGNSEALRLYDMAVKLACNHDWLLEEGLALYLEGCHFVRIGVENLGTELQRRGIMRQSQWGAFGIVRNLTAAADPQVQRPVKRSMFHVDTAIQTDIYIDRSPESVAPPLTPDIQTPEQVDGLQSLSPSDLILIIRKTREIADCLSLSSALQRLTEIAAGSLMWPPSSAAL
ncbi:hypothetical protein ID866_393 [Astraeus odoratus]|nr:hypothetical protein ID866_393 [Astraeus odoratus]